MNKTWSIAAVLVLITGVSTPAQSQMAAALGKPLPVSSMKDGTATVRVIAGSPDKALVGIDVQLVTADGKALTARTDSEGRATFNNLQPGGQYTAKAKEPADESGGDEVNEAVSEPFQMPASGGIRMMISTRPWAGQGPAAGGGAGPMAGAMDPRQMSGIPRGDPAVAAGTLSVAIVKENVANRLPDHTVHLVGYTADGTTIYETKKTGADGRAVFDHLTPLTHAYYVLTTFDRGHGRPPDRVMSDPITMPPRVGVKLLLAGTPKQELLGPPIDDLAFLANQNDQVQPGQAHVQFWFRDQETAPKEGSLYELRAGEKEPVLVATVPMTQPIPADMDAEFGSAQMDANQPPGSVMVSAVAAAQQSTPLGNIGVAIEPAEPAADDSADSKDGKSADKKSADKRPAQTETPSGVDDGAPAPTPRVTDAQGQAQFTDLLPGRSYKLAVTLFNRRFESQPFIVPPSGAGLRIQVALAWRFNASGVTRFENLQPDKIYFVQASYLGRIQRTRPFQVVGDRGAVVGLPLFARPQLSFHMVGGIEDEYFGFSGEVGLINMSAMPWDPGPNGLLIPFPKGFIGGGVEEAAQDQVKIEPEKGLLLRSLMAPGRLRFRAGFSLKVADGGTKFEMPLPLGVFKGSIILIKNAGMQVLGVPSGVSIQQREAPDGRQFYQLSNINLEGGQMLSFTIEGLPERSVAEYYTRIVVGVMALILIVWALMHIFGRRQGQAAVAAAGALPNAERSRLRKLDKRREELLEQLVELEGKKRSKEIAGDAYKKARSKLRGKLEAVYEDIDKLEQA